MPLNYASLEKFASNFIEQTLQRHNEMLIAAKRLKALFEQASLEPDRLREAVEQAERTQPTLYTAKPTHEYPLASFPLPAQPLRFTLLAADGSQIAPNRHRALEFGLINIGLFKVRFGSAQPPSVDLISELLEFDRLFSEGMLIGDDEVGLHRDLRERVLIREHITSEDPTPVLTVTDGPLDLFYRSNIKGGAAQDAQQTVWELDRRLEKEGILSAGYIDKPGSTMLANMLNIYQSTLENQSVTTIMEKTVSDRVLLKGKLAPGHRSALFEIISKRSPVNPQRLRCAFFFMNVAREADAEWLVRVEVPYWLAQKPELVDFVHTALYHDAQVLDSHPYPYSLHRAHELALVRFAESDEIEAMLMSKLPPEAADLFPTQSHKSHWKGSV